MNDDDIILQPDASKTEDVNEEVGKTTDMGESVSSPESIPEDSASPRVFDFSSDFNISPVADDSPAQSTDTKISSANALPPSKPAPIAPKPVEVPSINLIKKDIPQAPAPKAPTPTQPAQYRETIETSQKWPFAFGKQPSANQPIMNPSANAAANAVGKNSPSSQPVKTIRSDGGEQASEKELQHPKTDLQRDILAILPNMKKGGEQTNPKTPPAAPINPRFVASSESGLKPLRTYESDVAEVLSHRKTSTASIAIAENKKKTGEERLGNKEPVKETSKVQPVPQKMKDVPVPKRIMEAAQEKNSVVPQASAPKPVSRESAFRQDAFPQKPTIEETFRGGVVTQPEPENIAPKAPSHLVRNISLSLLSLIIVGGGLFGGYYLYQQSPLSRTEPKQNPTTTNQNISQKSLVRSDSQVLIATDGQSAQNIIARVREEISKPQTPNTIKDIVLTQNISGVKTQISPVDVARAINVSIPNVLLRTIQPNWMLGVYTDISGTKNIFIAATTDNFQNALSGMLGWESSLPRDLNAYINDNSSATIQGKFVDEIVKNKDVRAFVPPNDEKTVFLYSFVSNTMLVMSDSEVALSEVVTRLESQAFVR